MGFLTGFDASAATTGSSGIITSVASGAAGLLAAYSALKISKRDTTQQDLRDATASITALKAQVSDLQADLLDMRNYAFQIRAAYADEGRQTPAPPVLRSERH